jgi:hypothetical protein
MNRMKKTWLLILLASLSGCVGKIAQRMDAQFSDPAPATQRATSQPSGEGQAARPTIVPADPPMFFKPQVNLSIFHLTVPAGSVSRNEAFWKRVDEQAVDVGTYDTLYKNGVRVGRASMADLEFFIKTLDRNPIQTQPTTFASAGAKSIEVAMKDGVQDQTIADFNAKNVMTVRSFEDCDNIWCVEFQPTPRKPGDVRVAMCPMVRTLRKRLVAIGDVDTREVEYRSPEKFYQLNLKTDIPIDSFLIIAPSPEAQWKMSLGNAFLMRDGAAEKLEEVLLVVPQAVRRRPEKPAAEASTQTSGK